MKCFNHHDRDAFGIDTFTGKGLCLECMELYNGCVIEKNNEFSRNRVDITNHVCKQQTKASINLRILMIVLGIATFITVGLVAFFERTLHIGWLIVAFICLSIGSGTYIKKK